jgi:ParB/RepB/Spo0J family partition protein
MESPSKPAKPGAGLPAMPPMTRAPNIFADLRPGSAPRRGERHDPTATAVVGRQHLSVALTAVVAPSGLQTRAPFCPDGDDEDRALVESLEQDGQQVPVFLERLANQQAGEYRILDGHRRIAALRHLGKTQIEAIVVQAGTEDADLLTLTANVRKNLAPLELADAINRLVERGLTHKDIGRRIGMSRPSVDILVNLLRFAEPLREQIRAGRLSVRAATEWMAVPPEHHEALARLCAEAEVTSAQARAIAELVQAGRTVDEAAVVSGCVRAAGQTAESSEPTASAKVRPARRNQSLGLEAAGDLLRGYFPDLEPRTVRSLAEATTRRKASVLELKTAGCFAAAGMPAAEALDRARAVASRPWVRKVVAVLDCVAELEALCTGDRCPPEAAQVFPVLARRVGAVKTLGRGR